MKLLLLTICGAFIFASTAGAMSDKRYYKKQIKRIKKAAKKIKRKPTSTLSVSSEFFKQNRKELFDLQTEALALDSAEKIDNFIKKIDTNYDKYTLPDTKYFALQLISMRSMRGILWRLDSLLSSHLGDGRVDSTNSAQNLFISMARQFTSFTDVFLKFSQNNYWTAGYSYLAEPHEFSFQPPVRKISKACERHKWGKAFADEKQLRNFFACEVHPEIELSEKRMSDLLQSYNPTHEIIWDNRNLFGPTSFSAASGDDINRFRKLSLAELHNTMASIQTTKFSTEVATAYKLKGFVAAFNKMGRKMANVNLLRRSWSNEEALSARVRKDILNNVAGGQFLRLDKSKMGRYNGKTWMNMAYGSLQRWFYYADLARLEIENTSGSANGFDQQMFFNPTVAQPFIQQTGLGFQNWKGLLNNQSFPIVSTVTGKTQRVSLKRFFSSPPNDLKAFLPTRFRTGQWVDKKNTQRGLADVKTKKIGRNTYKYRDYTIGTPEGWNKSAFSPYFPGLESDADVKEAARTLSQAWGGMFFASPFLLTVL